MFDLIIIGAGPAGITAASESKKAGLNYLVIEKGLIGNTIYNYPVGLTVFSTVDELEINEGGLKPAREKPTREELLSYYVRFVLDNELNIQTEETVIKVESSPQRHREAEAGGQKPDREGGLNAQHGRLSVVSGQLSAKNDAAAGGPSGSPPYKGGVAAASADGVVPLQEFIVTTDKARYQTKNILFAIGAMDHPRKLNVPGEDLPKVHLQFRETYPWVKKNALIVGGGNSAGEAALFLAQEGAETTLAIFRRDWENTDPKQGCIKYWVRQPLEEELNQHCLKLFFLGKVIEIREKEVELESESGERVVIPNDVVFVLIGSDADMTMLKNLGVETVSGKYGEVPVYDPETHETNVSGIYVAGHFTNERHIKGAIEVPRKIIPHIAESLRTR